MSCVKYSTDDSTLAVATTDNAITVFFKSLAAYEKTRVISVSLSGVLTHMDWSLDCRYLRGATNLDDLLFWEVERNGRQVPNVSLLLCNV